MGGGEGQIVSDTLPPAVPRRNTCGTQTGMLMRELSSSITKISDPVCLGNPVERIY